MSDKFPNHTSQELKLAKESIDYYLNNPPYQMGDGQIYILKNILRDIENSIHHKGLLDEKVECIYCDGTGYAKDLSNSFDGEYCTNCYGKGYID